MWRVVGLEADASRIQSVQTCNWCAAAWSHHADSATAALILFVAVVTLSELLNPIVASLLVCTLLFPAISTFGTLSLNALWSAVQFRLSDVTLTAWQDWLKQIYYLPIECLRCIGLYLYNYVAAYCLYFFLFVFFFGGGEGGISVFLGHSLPRIANQLCCFCLCNFVLWFAANKFDLIWFDLIWFVRATTRRSLSCSSIVYPMYLTVDCQLISDADSARPTQRRVLFDGHTTLRRSMFCNCWTTPVKLVSL